MNQLQQILFLRTSNVSIIKIRGLATAVVWTLLIAGAAAWNVHQARRQALQLAETEARISLAKDLAFRTWAGKRGNMYLPQGALVTPSPFLNHVPDRDITTREGDRLTLKNPAMIMNEITREAPQLYGVRTRITSRLYLNPVDAPDEWERAALFIVEGTREDYHGLVTIDGKPHLRMMQPMVMEESCLKCHAWTGIKVGELRGGTDVSIPLDPFYAAARAQTQGVLVSYAALWFLGIGAIGFITRRTLVLEVDRCDREAQVREKNLQLESEVTERKKAQQQLAAIFDFLPDATMVVDQQRRVIAWNRAMEQMSGVPKEEMIGLDESACTVPFYGERRKHLIDLIDVPDAEIEALYSNVTRRGETFYAEAYVPALFGGKGAYVWGTVAPLCDQQGKRLGVIESIRDITEQKNLENELRHSHQHLLNIIDFMPDATLIIDREGRVLVWSRELARLTGVPPEQMIGKGDYEYALPFYRERRPMLVDLVLNANVEVEEQHYEGFTRNGDTVHGECFAPALGPEPPYLTSSACVLRDSKGEVIGAIECIRDNSEQMKAQRRIKLLAKIFNESGEAIVITDSENRIIETNRAFEQFTGCTREEALGKNPRILKSGVEDKTFYDTMWCSILETNYWQGEIWDKRKDGSLYPKWLTITAIRGRGNLITNYFASFSDITQRKEAERRIEQLAHTDTLTSLPNRHTLVERLSQALEQAKRGAHQLAVFFVDLDRFKTINDTLGHHVGDLLLKEVAARLKSSLRAEDIVARFGGDEFVVVQPQIRSQIEPAHLAEKILQTVSAPYFLDNNTVYTSPSIGISVFPHDGTSVSELFKNADIAMYHAKAAGRNTYQMFTREMHTAARQRLAMENNLRSAITNDEFVLHYQPQVETATGRVVGFEALVRWQSPDAGLVSPDRFISIAEETGLILEIGRHVFEKACAQAAAWTAAGVPFAKIGVNLSARQLQQPDLPELLANIMAAHGVEPGMIELEVTESMTMERPVESVRILGLLKGMGIDLAIDDFGTGYSSLSYLKLFPVDKLKIDRSFVKDIEIDPDDAAIASATIAMAHSLGKKVVAEGVETAAQLEFLVRHGCDVIQGYLFSKPLPAEDAVEYLKTALRTGMAKEVGIAGEVT